MSRIARFVIWICSKFTKNEIQQIIAGLLDVLAGALLAVDDADDLLDRRAGGSDDLGRLQDQAAGGGDILDEQDDITRAKRAFDEVGVAVCRHFSATFSARVTPSPISTIVPLRHPSSQEWDGS